MKTGRRIRFSRENGDQNVIVPATQTALRRQPHVHNAGFFAKLFRFSVFSASDWPSIYGLSHFIRWQSLTIKN
jgi:hypothetical protein